MTEKRFRSLTRKRALEQMFEKGFPIQIRAFSKESFLRSPIFWQEEEEEATNFIRECPQDFTRFNLERAPREKAEEIRRRKIRKSKEQARNREIAAAIGAAVVALLRQQTTSKPP